MIEKESKNLMLKWNDDTHVFDPIESESDMNEGIFIELNEKNKTWKYFYIQGGCCVGKRSGCFIGINGLEQVKLIKSGGIRWRRVTENQDRGIYAGFRLHAAI